MGLRNQVVLEIYENFGTSFISLGKVLACLNAYMKCPVEKMDYNYQKIANIHGVLSVCRVLFHVLCGY